MPRRRETLGEGAVLTLNGALKVLPPSRETADQISKRSGMSENCQTSCHPRGPIRPAAGVDSGKTARQVSAITPLGLYAAVRWVKLVVGTAGTVAALFQ